VYIAVITKFIKSNLSYRMLKKRRKENEKKKCLEV